MARTRRPRTALSPAVVRGREASATLSTTWRFAALGATEWGFPVVAQCGAPVGAAGEGGAMVVGSVGDRAVGPATLGAAAFRATVGATVGRPVGW